MQKLVILAVLVAGLSLTFPMPSGATTLVVDQKVPACVAGDQVFTTIQDAVDFLPDVDDPNFTPRRIILVCPGTYNTGLEGGARVNARRNALTIVSTDGPRFTEISGAFGYGFIINAHRVTIEGFTVVGGQSAPGGTCNIGIFVSGGNENRVLRNVVRDAFTLGISIGTNRNIVNDNTVNHNGDGIVLGNRIAFTPCEQTTNGNDNVITNNTVENNASRGILVYGAERNRVVGNDVRKNQTGIAILPGQDPATMAIIVPSFTSVEANRVRDNETGVVEQGNDTECNGNNIRRNVQNFQPPQGACASEDNQLRYIGDF
jgi:parallel beta-helix repeat protein